MALTVSTAPTVEPVILAELAAHLRVTGTDDNSYLTALIAQARRTVENQINRALISQTLRLTLDMFPAGRVIYLERAPLQSITSIKYQDTADVEQTLSSASYQADIYSSPARIILKDGYTWPSTKNNANAVTILFVAGYGAAGSAVPDEIRLAIMHLAGHWYANREPVNVGNITTELPKMLDYLIMPYKVWT